MLAPPPRQRRQADAEVVGNLLALSEESGSAIKSGPPVVSCGNLTPFGKGVRSAEFEVMAAAKMTFLVKMVVN